MAALLPTRVVDLCPFPANLRPTRVARDDILSARCISSRSLGTLFCEENRRSCSQYRTKSGMPFWRILLARASSRSSSVQSRCSSLAKPGLPLSMIIRRTVLGRGESKIDGQAGSHRVSGYLAAVVAAVAQEGCLRPGRPFPSCDGWGHHRSRMRRALEDRAPADRSLEESPSPNRSRIARIPMIRRIHAA